MVADYLTEFFEAISDSAFTAKMESELDQIANGTAKKKKVMTGFWGTLAVEIDAAKRGDPATIFKTDTDCPSCKDGSKMVRKVGKHGVFLGCENYPTCGHIMNFDEDGKVQDSQVETGLPCPICSSKIIKKKGKFGDFHGCSSYPTCNWTGTIDASGNVITKKKAVVSSHKCPKCSDGMLTKRSRRDGTGEFYGCNKYPKCKTAMSMDDKGNPVANKFKSSSNKPKPVDTGKVCPKCNKGTLLKRKGKFGDFLGCSAFPKCKHIDKGR
jgi:DNA topoisomerase-1